MKINYTIEMKNVDDDLNDFDTGTIYFAAIKFVQDMNARGVDIFLTQACQSPPTPPDGTITEAPDGSFSMQIVDGDQRLIYTAPTVRGIFAMRLRDAKKNPAAYGNT